MHVHGNGIKHIYVHTYLIKPGPLFRYVIQIDIDRTMFEFEMSHHVTGSNHVFGLDIAKENQLFLCLRGTMQRQQVS